MVEKNGEYRTTDTPLAAYLIQEGYALLVIEYTPKPNGKQQATFVFDDSNPKIHEYINSYNRGEARGNIALYEHARTRLIERLMRGLP